MMCFLKNIKDSSGFTLMEVVVATGIFVIMVMATLGIFSSVIRTQRNTLAQSRLEREAQLIMETMVKSVRSARVDYAEYVRLSGQPDITNPTSTLILVSFNDERVAYRLNSASSTIEVVNSGIPSPLTSDTVAVTGLDFIIHPVNDPFIIGAAPAEQPRVTIVMTLTSTEQDQVAQATVQQTVPQRSVGY